MEVEKKEMQMREVVTESYTLCDKCNKKIRIAAYDAFAFEFEYKTGDAYNDSGNGCKSSLDLCPECAPDAIELLKSNGYQVRETKWDY